MQNPPATILLAEDSPTISTVMFAVLTGAGYEVLMAKDGVEALKLALTAKPGLIITDAQMPRLDGYGLLRTLRSNPITATIPIVLLTAGSPGQEKEREQALSAGFAGFIPKPVQPLQVLSSVRQAIEEN